MRRPHLRVRRRTHGFRPRLIAVTALAACLTVSLSGSGLPPLPASPLRAAPVADGTTVPEGFDLEVAAQVREDQCRLGYVLHKGGQAMKAVARDGLAGTDAELHTAADPDYWNGTALAAAFQTDRQWSSAKIDELSDRSEVWEESLNLPNPEGYTYTGFQWAPDDPDIFQSTGLGPWISEEFWKAEDDFYVDLTPVASQKSADAVTEIATTRYDPDRAADFEDWQAWEGMTFMHPMYADDARIFLQNGGFPTRAPEPGTLEFRIDVENLKARFASCASADPPDPHHVLGAELAQASLEWQAELDGQADQRDAILAAEAKASADLQIAAQAMGEALGQSMIAGRLADWQAYWLKADPDDAFYPTAEQFDRADDDLRHARARASGRLYVAHRAALAAQQEANKAAAAQQEAYGIADAAGLPRGRGLMYAQQAVQITKAAAAAAQAAAQATETAVHATRASASDSDALNELAMTQAHATKAEFHREAAEAAEAQAQAAAQGAAAQAAEAAQNASRAKAAQQEAEAAEQTAEDAAADAAAQRKKAESERDYAQEQKQIAADQRAKAAAAEQEAQRQRSIAADRLSDAQSAGQTASDKKDAALAAEQKATDARDRAREAERDRNALSARASALEARAAALEGTADAADARSAADAARAAANDATDAAVSARAAARDATNAAESAREAATKAQAAASRAQAAADQAQADVAITDAAVKKAHAAAAEAIDASWDAAQNSRAAQAEAKNAKEKAAEARTHAGQARTEADAAARDAVITAGYAYSTANAAAAARDSARLVAQPADDAIALGAPYRETDSSAGLAVLTGQAAKTAAAQQQAVAEAKADQAADAAEEAAALAEQADADAKAAAQAAAAAATHAAHAAQSAAQARASAAQAAAAKKAAIAAEEQTVRYDEQAEADAQAAQTAATAAGGYADDAEASATAAEQDAASARGAADAAESDAATAQSVADQADADADTAEAAAARAREAAEEAEAAADRAERAVDADSQAVRMSENGPAGVSGVVTVADVTDEVTPLGDCTGTHTGDEIGCEIDLRHHITGSVHYILLTCSLPDTLPADCIGHFTGDYLTTQEVDFTRTVTTHIDGWELTENVLKSVGTAMIQDFIDCSHGELSGCAWAVGSLIAPTVLSAIARSVKAFRVALRSGSGIAEALSAVRATAINPTALSSLERLARAAGNCFPAGTPVAVAGGTKRIEDIRVGDRVWAEDPTTGERRLRRVTHLTRHVADAMVAVRTDRGVIEATPEHPFWVNGQGWTRAEDVQPGARLSTRDGHGATVASVRTATGPVPVYNFGVEGDHTFFAGEPQALVHNTCRLWSNKMSGTLAEELALAEQLGIRPASPGSSAWDEFLDFDGEWVKWAVLEDGSLVIMPKVVGGRELSHPVLSGGSPVRAAGEAQIAGSAESGYFGLEINNHSGHFFVEGDPFWAPGGGAVEVGKEAFAGAGVMF